jgi:hypothetical protein
MTAPDRAAEIRDRLAELDRLFWSAGYDRQRELEGYRLRGELGRLQPDAPDVVRDRRSWAQDAKS